MDCPICKLPEKDVTHRFSGDRCEIGCARCGSYAISRTVRDISLNRAADFKLSAWIRSRNDGQDRPLITSYTLDELGAGLPSYRVPQKQLLFLRALEQKSDFAGKKVPVVKEFDFPLAWCSSATELEYIIRALLGRGLLSLEKYSDPSDAFALELSISPVGWAYLDEHAKPAQFSNQAFVAKAFADGMLPAWKRGIELALSALGYQAYRTDAEPHIDRIDVKIMAEIKNSRFVVADVTLQRPGVYFEAGFAIGLGLPVFWSVREDDSDNVHFDTRQYNHIVWKTEEHLREQLEAFVSAIVGKGTAT